jgi:hypothetical protein
MKRQGKNGDEEEYDYPSLAGSDPRFGAATGHENLCISPEAHCQITASR